jgi:hypothetical protein
VPRRDRKQIIRAARTSLSDTYVVNPSWWVKYLSGHFLGDFLHELGFILPFGN